MIVGYVVGKVDMDVIFIFLDGIEFFGKILGVNFCIDFGLMKIMDEGSFFYVDMGDFLMFNLG